MSRSGFGMSWNSRRGSTLSSGSSTQGAFHEELERIRHLVKLENRECRKGDIGGVQSKGEVEPEVSEDDVTNFGDLSDRDQEASKR